jgi:hypothetical protein
MNIGSDPEERMTRKVLAGAGVGNRQVAVSRWAKSEGQTLLTRCQMSEPHMSSPVERA